MGGNRVFDATRIKMVSHAYKTVPAYRRLLEKRGLAYNHIEDINNWSHMVWDSAANYNQGDSRLLSYNSNGTTFDLNSFIYTWERSLAYK